jgi:predicted ArsR family transcriptional regulator
MSSKPLALSLVADPVRLAVLERLAAPEGARLDELADAAGVHANTVRAHLGQLDRAGVLVREQTPTGARGRPRTRYRLAEEWRLPATDFRGLAELLATGLAKLAPSHKQLQSLGQDWGRWLAGRPGAKSAGELIRSALPPLGFHAEVDGDVVKLSRCPCSQVLPDQAELVCRLAAGVVDGVAAASTEALEVGSSVHDPIARRCELRLSPRSHGRHRLLPLRLRRG